jgi:trafficking protein particle complex subunit 9
LLSRKNINIIWFEDYKFALCFSGPAANAENGEVSLPPGRRLAVPLNICVVQGLRLVRTRLLSMEIPARFTETQLRLSTGTDAARSDNNLLEIDPCKGSWGLRLLELELFNPTDVVFDADVHLDGTSADQKLTAEGITADAACQKTRIDRDYSARVLIPLENFKLPVLDASFFVKESGSAVPHGSKATAIAERNAKAELNASINTLISKIKVRWYSGRNSSGELNIKDAIQAALQASIMDILLPDPLTFNFKLAKNGTATEVDSTKNNVLRCEDPISAHEMTHMVVQIRNNTKEIIRMNLSISCKDVAGADCFDENSATVLWAGKWVVFILSCPCLISVLVLRAAPLQITSCEKNNSYCKIIGLGTVFVYLLSLHFQT